MSDQEPAARRLSELVDGLVAGVSVRSGTEHLHGKAVLKTSAVSDGKFDPSEAKPILPNDIPRARCSPEADSLIISRMNTPNLVGEVGYVEHDYPDLFLPDRLWLARPRRGAQVDMRWLSYYLCSKEISRAIRDLATGTSGSMKNIPKERMLALAVVVPALTEQRRIAKTLRDVDDLIVDFERMLHKKRAIKQTLMRQLLTGQSRLSGFESAWEHRRVSEMGNVLAGKALNAGGAGVLRPYLRTKNVLDGRIELADILWMPMTDAEFTRFRVERGDVLLNEGQSLELVGRCSVYSGEFRAPCAMQNQLLRFRAYSGTSPEFAAHLFRHCQRTGVFAAIATQTTSVAHLGSSRFSNLRLRWPTDRREQVAIAEVLSDVDAEIAALETRRDKARAVKQGMMQELLTGRARLLTGGGAR